MAIDQLLARATPDVEARRALMQEIETILRGSGIVIQPYWRSVRRSFSDRAHGLRMHQVFEAHPEGIRLSA